MRVIFILLLAGIYAANAYSQIDSLKTISLDAAIMVTNLKRIKAELSGFFEENEVVPDLLNQSNSQIQSHFTLTQDAYYTFVQQIEHWGIITSKKIASVNYTQKLNAVNQEIARIEKQIEEYDAFLKQVGIQSGNHIKYWERLEIARTALQKQRVLQKEYLASNQQFKVKLRIVEATHLTNKPDFSFVNMPGIQYSYLLTANSVEGIYPQNMNGYSIKYILNRRKTYIELGLFKSNQTSENMAYNELYKFGIGQDFYSVHLGRGTRQFMNLYSGFQLGTFILTGNENRLVSWYATPSIGVEVYKNKNILIDTKTGYFLPFKENRNMRGFLLEASFNVLF